MVDLWMPVLLTSFLAVFIAARLFSPRGMVGALGRSHLRERADNFTQKGIRALRKKQPQRARVYLETALELFRDVDDWDGHATVMIHLGRVKSSLADKIGALACVEGILEREQHQESGLRFLAMMAKAEILHEHGDVYRALRCYRVALTMRDCPQNIALRPEATPLRHALARVVQEYIQQARLETGRGCAKEAMGYYGKALLVAEDPIFLPFSQDRFPFHLGQYSGLIRIERGKLHAQVGEQSPSLPQPLVRVLAPQL